MKGLKPPIKKAVGKAINKPAKKAVPKKGIFDSKTHVVFDNRLQVENLTDNSKLDQIFKLLSSQNLILNKILKAVYKDADDKKLDALIKQLNDIKTDVSGTPI